MLSSASATASRQADACPWALTKVSSPHMVAILSRARTPPFGTVGGMTDDQGTQSHDPDAPQRYLEFMRTGWRDTTLDVGPLPGVAHHAKRRSALAPAFPGETLVIPSGRERVRANDTSYRFRPGSDHVWLTG